MTREEFYERCARLLDCQHTYRPEPKIYHRQRHDGSTRNTYKTRWNGRDPGNGRFPGCGIIRHFGSVILVNLYSPPLTGAFATEQDVLNALAAVE